jgi:hypothetical protein
VGGSNLARVPWRILCPSAPDGGLRRLRNTRDRFVDEPIELLPKIWREWVLDDDGRVQRTRYEQRVSLGRSICSADPDR